MRVKRYYLTESASLKWLEMPSVYNIRSDELYELDEEGFTFLKECARLEGGRSDDSEFIEFCMNEGLLGERAFREKKVPGRRSPVPSLRYLELQITDRCNLKCRHCYIGNRCSRDLPVESVRTVLKEFEEMQGLRLLITGGEPLMYKHFDSLNDVLPDFELRKVLFTNGLLVTGDVLKGLNIDELQVSIDGLEKAHDLIRGRGTYERSIKATKRALDHGMDVSISTMIHAGNLDDFDAMEEMFSEIGIRDWTVDVPCLTGNLSENSDLLPPADVAGKYLKYGFGDGLHGGGEGYVCGLHLMSIMPDGSAAKCAFYADEPVGYINEGLESCWKKVEHTLLKDTECDCAFLDICRGGCRFRATIAGRPSSRDMYRCASFIDHKGQDG